MDILKTIKQELCNHPKNEQIKHLEISREDASGETYTCSREYDVEYIVECPICGKIYKRYYME